MASPNTLLRDNWLLDAYGTNDVKTLVMLWEAKTGGKAPVSTTNDRALLLHLWEANEIALMTDDTGQRHFVTKNANR